jgi:hypothetical protein
MIEGKRRDLGEDEYFLEQGEYGKNPEGKWYCRVPAPCFGVGGLGNHTIEEHEDGTITVSPSILSYGSNGKQWHGYLERGFWRQV